MARAPASWPIRRSRIVSRRRASTSRRCRRCSATPSSSPITQHSLGPESSVIKIFGSELLQSLNELLIEAAGGHALDEKPIDTERRRGGCRGAVPAVAARDDLRRLVGNPAQRARPPRAQPSELTSAIDVMELHLTSEQTLLRDSAAKFIARSGAEGGARISRAGSELRARAAARRRASSAGSAFWCRARRAVSASVSPSWPWCSSRPDGGSCASRSDLRRSRPPPWGRATHPHPMLARVMIGRRAGRSGAAGERARRRSAARRARRRRAKAAALRLTGQKMFVCADGADGFLVSASGRDGPVLCYVARDARAARWRRRRPSTAASSRRSASRIRRPISFRRIRRRAMPSMRSTILR